MQTQAATILEQPMSRDPYFQMLFRSCCFASKASASLLQDKPQADRTRVGGATDDLLSEGGIGATVITASTKEGGNTAARNLSRLQTRNNTDKTLQQAYSQINRISDKLGLTKTITDTAQHYYKLVYESKGARGRGLAAVAAAVLFCACRQEGLPRTFKVHTEFYWTVSTCQLSWQHGAIQQMHGTSIAQAIQQ